MKRAVKIEITGTVQGIFFRQFIADNAIKLNLRGFVRNLDNGNVEIITEGETNDILKMIELCKQGPKNSQIKNVKVEERKYEGDFKEFKILRF
ncbi:MAG: acylphosphatase [Nanoarchaeota archaeon]|nr:acylphosphatase [Nanoarchaeota archaeon]